MKDLKGLYSALLIPFDENGEVKEEGLRQVIEHNINVSKVDGLYVNGSSGENFLLNTAQKKQIFKFVKEVVGDRVNLIAHRERGFSYKKDAPLDMRMNQEASLTAYEVVNQYDYHDLVRIFFKYGEDKFSKQIARKIEQARQVKPIETTTELAEIIKSAKPAKELKKKGHPAKQIFQAIRIEVNDELGAADESIQQAMDMLALDGRISVITFHSLEDRLTKQLFKEASTVEVPKGLPFIPDDLKPKMELVSRKPILPSKEELEANNRSHSAKLRVARKIHK